MHNKVVASLSVWNIWMKVQQKGHIHKVHGRRNLRLHANIPFIIIIIYIKVCLLLFKEVFWLCSAFAVINNIYTEGKEEE